MRALSGLTPALSRRLQRQLLAHLPPRAAARLRRTLSLHARDRPHDHPSDRPPAARSQSVSHPTTSSDDMPTAPENTATVCDDTPITPNDTLIASDDTLNASDDPNVPENTPTVPDDRKSIEKEKSPERSAESSKFATLKSDENTLDSASQFCTLPRVRRRKTLSRESDSPPPSIDYCRENIPTPESVTKDFGNIKDSSRRSQERSLLSKYLVPEKNFSLNDTTYSADCGSIISEPSYIAAYGSPASLNSSGLGFRRHSLRLSGDQSKKRISRFLRSDFFDTPADESLYAKHKKEKELETQKILKEIREKKNKSLESTAKSPVETDDCTSSLGSKDESSSRKSLSPITNLILKDRSRSNTPFFPILDNIKETHVDSSISLTETTEKKESNVAKQKLINKESKLSRPKSYPIKNFEKYDETNKNVLLDSCRNDEIETEDKKTSKESKLIRPKSYPSNSPSPEKVFLNRNIKIGESKFEKETFNNVNKERENPESKTDVEVSFSITLPKKAKSESQKKIELDEIKPDSKIENKKITDSTLTLKKYQVINSKDKIEKTDNTEPKVSNITDSFKEAKNGTVKDDSKTENQVNDKKTVVKKKIIKKVSSKSKTDLNLSDTNEPKISVEKKKITKKVKEKDKSPDDITKTTNVTKKKSVLQSIGHKLEKFASSKSNSPEKVSTDTIPSKESNIDIPKQNLVQREHSVPTNSQPPSESNSIKRAVTITDVAALENQNNTQTKTTVSKVLGLFKKFEPKEKSSKTIIEKNSKENINLNEHSLTKTDNTLNSNIDSEDKPKRPNSLLLNGLGRKNRYNKSSNDDVNNVVNVENSDHQVLKNECKNTKNTLKLDFSRLPRVKKIVPINSVIEPQIMNYSEVEKDVDKNNIPNKNGAIQDGEIKDDVCDTLNRSRSRSRSIYSNSDIKSETSVEIKDKNPLPDSSHNISFRNHESISPEKEDIVDRIRRKSFYSRFNEKKQRRKSSLVGPGATEYDPLARIHSHATDSKYDASPTSPGNYDLSPGLSVGSDISPSTERYRSLLTDLPINTRTNLRYEGINDKIDMYRSLDRKYSGTRSYLDYDQPSSYNSNRYSRTKSLFESLDPIEDQSYGLPRESHKYTRTSSLFSPGSYATYRPKRTRNSAIILKESEKEPSPENILDKIRQRKISISVTRKPDPEKESVPRSNVTPKSEGDGSERSAKID